MTDLSSTEYLAWLADECRDMGNAAHQQPGASKYMRTLWKAEKALREVLDRREAEGWRDISSAPKDGTTVLVYVPDFEKVTEAWFCEQTGLWPRDNAYSDEGQPCNVGMPTHWRPLPAPPSTPTTEASHGE